MYQSEAGGIGLEGRDGTGPDRMRHNRGRPDWVKWDWTGQDGAGPGRKGPDGKDETLQGQREPALSRHIPLPVSAANEEGGTAQTGPGKDGIRAGQSEPGRIRPEGVRMGSNRIKPNWAGLDPNRSN